MPQAAELLANEADPSCRWEPKSSAAAVSRPRRRRFRSRDQMRRNTAQAFWPPKPKPLATAASTVIARAVFGT